MYTCIFSDDGKISLKHVTGILNSLYENKHVSLYISLFIKRWEDGINFNHTNNPQRDAKVLCNPSCFTDLALRRHIRLQDYF